MNYLNRLRAQDSDCSKLTSTINITPDQGLGGTRRLTTAPAPNLRFGRPKQNSIRTASDNVKNQRENPAEPKKER
jgi:hypothetical protein